MEAPQKQNKKKSCKSVCFLTVFITVA